MPNYDIIRRCGFARSGTTVFGDEKITLPCVLEREAFLVEADLPGPFSNVPITEKKGPLTGSLPEPNENVTIAHPAVAQQPVPGSMILVANWHTTLGDPRLYTESLLTLRENYPPDAIWYAPASAFPQNVATLIASGFDLFDYTAVDLATVQGKFCTTDGSFPAAEWFGTGTCSCEGCTTGNLQLHNRLALDGECAVVRQYIKRGQLRELLERRCRADASQVGILRRLDRAYPLDEAYTPIIRNQTLNANCAESINRPEVKRFAERILERFIPSRTDVAVLIPCSARKPYSLSQSHHAFARAIRNRAHEIIITSPLGIVPRECERIYPAAHYDIPVTGYWDKEERAFVTEVLAAYLKKHGFERVVAHLDGDSLIIARQAAEQAGIPLEITTGDLHPTSKKALDTLDEALAGSRVQSPDIIRGTLSYQFGIDVDTKGWRIKGKMHRQSVVKGKLQLFSIDNTTGYYKPTFAGWKFLPDVYRITIDDFELKGDVLVPGVFSCDPAIREGDEVFVTGPQAQATGKAAMGAEEMGRSSRGVAVKTRKVHRG